MKKEHFEVILEDINSKLSNISEGHQVLDNKIDTINKELKGEIKELKDEMVVRFDYLDRKIDTTNKELKDYLEKKIDTGNEELKHEIRQIDKTIDNYGQRIIKIETKIGI